MDGKTLARLGALVFVAVAVTATAIEMTRKDDRQNSPTTQARSVTEAQADEVMAIYRQWFDLAQPVFDDGWSCISGTRKA